MIFNLGCPPRINLIGEIYIFIIRVRVHWLLLILLLLGGIIITNYSLRIIRITKGQKRNNVNLFLAQTNNFIFFTTFLLFNIRTLVRISTIFVQT